jgi:hypothetical protein
MHDWDDWQRESDDVATRVRNHRKQKRNVTESVTRNTIPSVSVLYSDSKSDSSLKEEKKDNEVTSWKNDESFTRLLAAADALKLVRSTDSATLHRLWINHDGGWCSLSGEQRKAAVDGLVFARYPDPAYAPTLEKYLYKKKWLETIRPASNGATDKKPVNFADEENRKNRLMIQQRRERERQA